MSFIGDTIESFHRKAVDRNFGAFRDSVQDKLGNFDLTPFNDGTKAGLIVCEKGQTPHITGQMICRIEFTEESIRIFTEHAKLVKTFPVNDTNIDAIITIVNDLANPLLHVQEQT